jgi:flagellar biosynthesis/type III secretory pathway protein FliH
MSLRGFVAPLVASAVLALPGAAFAQIGWPTSSNGVSPSRYRADDRQLPYYDARRTAYDQGYREGLKEGEKDARKGDRFSYQDEREFQRGDKGYHRNFGDRERYRQVFRDGYASGYSDGFSRYSRYGRNDGRRGPYQSGPYGQQGPYGQRGGYGGSGGGQYGRYPNAGYYSPAFDNGVSDGYEKGQEDARKHRSFDPLRHSWYRSGDRHFESRYGSRDQYKDLYRRGFQQGYEQGFREGRYRSW